MQILSQEYTMPVRKKTYKNTYKNDIEYIYN